MAKVAHADTITVTPENFNEYVDNQLGIVKNDDPEQIAAKELVVIEEKKVADKAKADEEKAVEDDPTHDVPELHEEKKKGINERFTKLSAKAREAEEKAVKAIANEKLMSERIAKLEMEDKALRDKYEPVKTEQDPEPQIAQFKDVTEYSKALKEWSADDAIRKFEADKQEKAKAAEKEQVIKGWTDRQTAVKAEIKDYAETISESTVTVSDQIRDAIYESDVGPQILYHLAKHPEIAEEMSKLTIGKALIKFGKMESFLAKDEVKQVQGAKIGEISKAPAPISPIKSGVSASTNKIDSNGEFVGTFDEWKALRKAGKIK